MGLTAAVVSIFLLTQPQEETVPDTAASSGSRWPVFWRFALSTNASTVLVKGLVKPGPKGPGLHLLHANQEAL
jgi:hypothetical protein